MSTYELDDDLVRRVLQAPQVGDKEKLMQALHAQLLITDLPERLGAVVETKDRTHWVYAELESTPWRSTTGSWNDSQGLRNIGITAVLSEGVTP